uniref:Aminopeptidase N-like N-terminal domain-containing protein n=1 Tax=Panagrolaimus sp. JU765 TaxID=591449 RepID=A0AC34QCY7_9BILA
MCLWISKKRLPHNLVVNQYDITIQPYFDAPGVTYPNGRNQTFDGNVRIQFKMTAYAQSISLDVYNMSIIRASLFRGTIRQQLVSAGYDSNANRYTLSPVYFLQPNVDYSIEMNYTGNIFDYDHGGLFSSVYAFPNGTWGAVYATHFETFPDQYSHYDPVIGSARLFPCFDDPHFKSYFNLTLIYPKSLTAIANTLDASTNDYG